MSTTSTPAFFCRWGICPKAFPTLPELRAHFVHDHVPAEVAEYVPAHKRRRRADGGWELVEQPPQDRAGPDAERTGNEMRTEGIAAIGVVHRHSTGIPPAHDHDLHHAHAHGFALLDMSSTTLSSMDPSFVVPSLPGSFTYSQSMEHDRQARAHVHQEPENEEDAAAVDYSAFLRSPSPGAGPVQSTPLSQVPPASQGSQPDDGQNAPPVAISSAQIRQVQTTTTTAADTSTHSAASAANTSGSSAQHVSPARGATMTQAIPPPSTTQGTQGTPGASQKSTGSAGNTGAGAGAATSPANSSTHSNSSSIQIAFGAASTGVKAPGRKVSASGFTWGLGTQ